MARRTEIPLPVSGPMRYGFRAFREGGAVDIRVAGGPLLARLDATEHRSN